MLFANEQSLLSSTINGIYDMPTGRFKFTVVLQRVSYREILRPRLRLLRLGLTRILRGGPTTRRDRFREWRVHSSVLVPASSCITGTSVTTRLL